MRHLKMLGLAAMATMIVIAFAGTSSASATVLCKTNTTPCTSAYEVGQEVHAEVEATLLLHAGFAVTECKKVTIKGSITSRGSATETTEVALDEAAIVEEGQSQKTGLHFGECTGSTTVEKAGKLILHSVSGTMNATVTSEGMKVKFVQAGVTCFYGTSESGVTDLGTLTGSNVTGITPTWDFSAEMKKEAGSGFLCANPAHWEGSFKMDTPMELFAAEAGPGPGGVLCKTNTTPCGEKYGAGQNVEGSAESTLVLHAGFGLVECEGSTLKGSITTAGGEASEAEIGLNETGGLTFSKCTGEVWVEQPGQLLVKSIAGTMNGAIGSKGAKVKVRQAGITCVYGTPERTEIGTLTGTSVTGGTPTLDLSAELTKEAGSGALCASPAHWEGSYKLETPMEGYVAAS